MEYTLTMLDTIGIQKYIFSSNRLRENIGASELVERAIKQWAYESLPCPNNVENCKTGELNPDLWIDKSSLAAEVIYAGGGNTAILFESIEKAKAFTRKLSEKILIEAPGLQFATVHLDIDYQQKELSKKVKEALRKLGKAQRSRPANTPTLGLSVTTECQSTGLPAAGTDPWKMEDEPTRLVSLEVAAKVMAAKSANARLASIIDNEKYAIPRDFDDLARIHGQSSYLAVVHADGNSIGQRVKKLADQFDSPEQNRDYINAMRVFSKSIGDASEAALKACVDFLDRHIEQDPKNPDQYILADSLVLDKKQGQPYLPYLPFRPLIFGGDDVTFVCNGQIGLALAAKYLQTFEQQKLKGLSEDKDREISACAGVTVVKLHYPFSRAYALSEELCQKAKGDYPGLSALDWHFSTTGLAGDLELIRKREYTVDVPFCADVLEKDGNLCLRPLRLNKDPDDDLHSWPVVNKLINEFSKGDWSQHRNKVKRLREALRQGAGEVEKFTQALREQLPAVEGLATDVQQEGWHNGECVYFDAIEAMDYGLLLDTNSGKGRPHDE